VISQTKSNVERMFLTVCQVVPARFRTFSNSIMPPELEYAI